MLQFTGGVIWFAGIYLDREENAVLTLGVGGSKRDSTASGLKSSSRQNKTHIDVAIPHTVS